MLFNEHLLLDLFYALNCDVPDELDIRLARLEIEDNVFQKFIYYVEKF